ncbi:efflux RND transporter permease subunit [Paraburkholderia elongata]|uniref:MMPL family transporter n=1 Tax=Paraburkholderia elongata TaxID=2675747 RepID=A0A972SFQ4_9BURK|nr:efflux RND transporter permease subunit [Paraburkholderia elongata]NPT53052.1 MMPL family transporter [Paraburkholderia elongata]
MKNATFSKLERFVEFCIRNRVAVTLVYVVLTLVMVFFASRIEIKTVFDDLLPRSHPYVQVHERFKEQFGGSNVVSIMVQADKGDIFQKTVLDKVKKITTDLALVHGVNTTQIISIASPKLKEIRASTDAIESKPVMFPDVPQTPAQMSELKTSILNNPLVHGTYVSQDLKAALITVDFYESELDYQKIYDQIYKLAQSAQGGGVTVSVVGEPILFGWVTHYVPETLKIFTMTIVFLATLLFIIMRTWRGTLLPLLAGTTSAIWSLGAAKLFGFNFDPLVIVIAFLITARSISHSVQLVSRFGDEIESGVDSSRAAAHSAMLQLFKPGMLGVIADAGCMIVVVLTPIPLMQKVAIVGTIWVLTIALTACVMTPILLSWVRQPRGHVHPLDVLPLFGRVLDLSVTVATSRFRYVILSLTAIVFVVSGAYALNLHIGDADAGSPILWQNSRYNVDSAAINHQFQGTDRMYAVFEGNGPDAVKEPKILSSMEAMQRYMGAQPEIGGSLSIADVLPAVNQILHEDNPRYHEFGKTRNENGELIYMWGPDAGEAGRYMDPQARNSSVTFYFKDHRGDTIRTAMARLKEFIANNPVEHGKYLLAGGLIGVTAAVNEVILSGQVESVALALLWLAICCAIAYRTARAGIFFMIPVMLSNTITFSFMAWKGIGMTLSTLPVAALGIGLGVDYTFYVVDGIREELHKHNDVKKAIEQSIRTAGKGVLITALTLTVAVGLWSLSTLRFQAEMSLLMGIWLFVSAFSALFIMPALVYVFQPEFVVGNPSMQAEDREAAPQVDVLGGSELKRV